LYAVRVEALSILEKQSENHAIDLYYADESGVSEQGYCPYAWQFKDEKVSIPSAHGQQINCFGLLSRENELFFKTTTDTINTAFLIAFFDEFVIKCEKITVIVMDNAKIHRSKAFTERSKYWAQRGLFFVFLPPYSPHLNIIERLWLELKQRWLKPEDYQSFEKLNYAVQLALMAVGKDLKINFNSFNYTAN
jgi:transposase